MKRLLAMTTALVLATTLTACGNDSDESASSSNDSGVTVSGDFGKEPKVAFEKTPFSVKESSDWRAIEGDGDKIAAADSVSVHVTLFNGKTGEKVISTLDSEGKPLTVAKEAQNLFPVLVDTFEGEKEGSRIVVEAAPEDAYGEQGQEQLKVKGDTTIVMVADLLEKVEVLKEPKGEAVPPKPGDPKLKLKDGVPSGFDFEGATKPKELKVITLIEGEGEKTEKGQSVTVNYLGSEWGSKKVFDASYPRNQTFNVTLGEGGVIKAWDQGLVGVPVGSRVLIIAPPELAYGKAGQPPAIGKNATLVFVVDVLSAS